MLPRAQGRNLLAVKGQFTMQKKSEKGEVKFTKAEVIVLAVCLIAVALLLALHRYRPRNDYAKPESYSQTEMSSENAVSRV